MARYIDGFVLPLAKDKVETYRGLAEKAGRIWKEHGALEYIECVGDDLEAPGVLPFAKLAAAGPEETVIFAYIVYESRAHRDAVNEKVMKDPRMELMCGGENMPFDPGRMAFGGFKPLVIA